MDLLFWYLKSFLFVRNVTHAAQFQIDLTKESGNFSSPCPAVNRTGTEKRKLNTLGRFSTSIQ